MGIEVANEGEEEILFKCPFHDDKNPSASYNIRDRVYNCFVCGGGSLRSLAKDEFIKPMPIKATFLIF